MRDSQAWRVNNARELVGIDAYESRHRLVFSQRGGQEPSSFTIVTRRGLRPRRTQRRHDFVLVFPGRPSTSCHYYVFSVRVISLGAAGIYRVSTEHQEIAAESPPFPRFLFFLSFFSSSFFRFLRCTAVMTLALSGYFSAIFTARFVSPSSNRGGECKIVSGIVVRDDSSP